MYLMLFQSNMFSRYSIYNPSNMVYDFPVTESIGESYWSSINFSAKFISWFKKDEVLSRMDE